MKQALFIIGGWDGHQPQACANLVIEALRSRDIHARQVHAVEAIDDALLRDIDVIVPCWTMGDLPYEQTQAIDRRVQSGCGLAGWHGGMGDAFRTNTDYQFMVGGQFVAHPGNIIDYDVTVANRDHPITRGLPATFAVRSEQYYMHTDPGNTVLAHTVFDGEHASWVKGVRMPVVWTRQHGLGRVAYCSIGHAPEDLVAHPVLELVTRAITWAAGETVDAPLA
jgi:type 1 glutamine amidotransferase